MNGLAYVRLTVFDWNKAPDATRVCCLSRLCPQVICVPSPNLIELPFEFVIKSVSNRFQALQRLLTNERYHFPFAGIRPVAV